MTLKEKLEELVTAGKISADDVKDINTNVDGIKAKAIASKEDEIKTIQGDLDKRVLELKPFKEQKRNTHISKIVEGITDEAKIAATIKLSGITDEDDDEAIKIKFNKAIEDNAFLGKTVVDDKSALKVETKKEKLKPKTETKKEYRFMKSNS